MTWYRYVNALSLDVMAGVVVCTFFFARLIGVTLPTEVPMLLALAVWSIYTLDHLWDARRSKCPRLTFRYQFHKQHFNTLALLLSIIIIAGLVLLPRLPVQTLWWGVALSLTVVVHFLLSGTKMPVYHKELLIATIYTGGILTGPVSLLEGTLSAPLIFCMLLFMGLALTNLLIFAYYESDQDRLQRFASLIGAIGTEKSRILIHILLMTVLVLSMTMAISFHSVPLLRNSFTILFIMACALALIFYWPGYFAKNDRFRFFGDGVFIIPLLGL